jgi:hypothetical protein
MATEFVRARNEALDAETVLPASALPYLDGWERVSDDPQPADAPAAVAPPAPDEPAADAAVSVESAPPGATPVGRPTRTPSKES